MKTVSETARAIYVASGGTTRLRYMLFKNNNSVMATKIGSDDVILEYSEISGGKGVNTAYNHQIYTLAAKTFTVQYNYFHGWNNSDGNVIKARDETVNILYNYIDMAAGQNAIDRDTNENGTIANLLVMGNVIVKPKGEMSDSTSAIKRRASQLGYVNILNNTFVDEEGSIGNKNRFLAVKVISGETYEVSNNIFTGINVKISQDTDTPPSGNNNFIISGADIAYTNFTGTIQAASAGFVGGGDYHLAAGSPNIDVGYNFTSNLPNKQYKAIANSESRSIVNNTIDIGAFEFGTEEEIDTTSPTTPTNLTATAISSTQINLSWTASRDNVGLAGYKIYRNGSLLTTQNSQLTTYSDTGLQPSTTYSYTVSAFDAAGNESAQSDPVPATTLPSPPKGDVNCDKTVDILDVQALVNHILGAQDSMEQALM